MNPPKMILFDSGDTMLQEPDVDMLRGMRALFPYIKTNPDNLSAEQVNAFALQLFAELAPARSIGVETHERQFQRILYECLGITFSVSLDEAEEILWTAAIPGAIMPDADKILDAINRSGIRSGVISNIGWSGNGLKRRMDRLLPGNRFEFVITSSEYAFCKPSPHLFALALRKAGLPPDEVWFCGDHPQADVEAASRAGMTPVWYDQRGKRERLDSFKMSLPACGHVYIREWDELIRLLEGLDVQA